VSARFLAAVCVAAASAIAFGGVAGAQAGIIQNITLPLSSLRSQDCTGGIVQLDGTVHLVAVEAGNGALVGHLNYQNVTATDEATGATYRVSSVDNHVADLAGGDVVSVGNIHLVGAGPGDNLVVQALTHVTVNANGEVTAEISELRSDCR
jgi:hypothetical protein